MFSFAVKGRRGADGRLSSAQTALMLQEETIRRLERERKGLNEKISAMDSSIAQAEADRRQLRDKVTKLQQSEAKSDQEKEAMRSQIENAETRLTKIELKKRSLAGKFYLMITCTYFVCCCSCNIFSMNILFLFLCKMSLLQSVLFQHLLFLL